MRKKWPWLVVIVVVLGAFGLWLYYHSHTGQTATISGTAMVSPTSPVCQFGGPCSKPLLSYSVEVNDSAGKKVAKTKSDMDGKFRVKVKPGRYTLIGTAIPVNLAIGGGQQPVVVADGEDVRVVIRFDSGIR